MPLTPFPVNEFPGLNLAVDPVDLGMTGAVDLLNVDLGTPGQLRTRDGTSQWNATTRSSTGNSALHPTTALTGTALLAIRYSDATNVNIDKITTAGATTNLGSFAAGTGTFCLSHTDFGDLTQTLGFLTFVTQPSTGVQLRTIAAGALGNKTYKPLYAGISPVSNRLVLAGFLAAADTPSGANGSRSTVFFSDAGLATTFTSTSWVALQPGDGEVITGIATFANETFVFKQSSVFIFYGEGQNSDGTPIFNYRRVGLPDPLSDPVVTAPTVPFVVAGPDAVYYSTTRGVWRTTGGAPQMVSTPVRRIFSHDSSVSTSLRNSTDTPPSLAWVAGRLVATYTASAVRQLVWDPPTDTWALWDIPGISFAQYPAGSAMARDQFFYVAGSGDNNIFVMKPANTDDSGTPIAWSYTTGYSSAGGYFRQRIVSSGERKKHFKTDILGSGTVTHQLLTLNGRPNDVADTGSSVTLGTAPAIARGSRRRGARGTHFAQKLSGSGPAVVSGLTYWLSEISMDT